MSTDKNLDNIIKLIETSKEVSKVENMHLLIRFLKREGVESMVAKLMTEIMPTLSKSIIEDEIKMIEREENGILFQPENENLEEIGEMCDGCYWSRICTEKSVSKDTVEYKDTGICPCFMPR